MREHLETIWRFETSGFVFTVDAFADYDVDLSFDEDGETLRQLERGDLTAFSVRARALHKASGVEGEDWLGGCIYRSPSEFRDHFGIRKHANCGSYFSDMVRASVAECRAALGKAAAVRLRTH